MTVICHRIVKSELLHCYRPELPAFGKHTCLVTPRAPAWQLLFILTMKRNTPMFARILDFEVKLEKKEEFVKVVKNQIVPILKKQTGFLEILPFFPEKMREDKVITISLWTTKSDADRYEREFYPKALD